MNTLNRFRKVAFGITLLAGLTIAFALLARDGRLTGSHDELVVCATSKGALCASTLAEGLLHVAAPSADNVADLGAITVFGRREAKWVADLGSLTVTARRFTSVVSNLGEMTVAAPREADVRVASVRNPVAYLGSITVSAPRIAALTASARVATSYGGSLRPWN